MLEFIIIIFLCAFLIFGSLCIWALMEISDKLDELVVVKRCLKLILESIKNNKVDN